MELCDEKHDAVLRVAYLLRVADLPAPPGPVTQHAGLPLPSESGSARHKGEIDSSM